MLSFELAKQLFYQDPLSGELRWSLNHNSQARKGQIAGTLDTRGHLRVTFGGRTYGAHRIVWLLAYGEFPPEGKEIDHINRVKTDNRLENLRCVTRMVNMRNRPLLRNNTSGVTGVCFHRASGKWSVRMPDGHGGRLNLGLFETKETAIYARYAAETDLEGYNA